MVIDLIFGSSPRTRSERQTKGPQATPAIGLVAEMNELVVGFMALEGDHVDHLYTASAYQGRGIRRYTSGYDKGVAP